jgi:hypothetical protein
LPASKVKIQPAVAKALGFADLSRPALVRLITRLLTELPADLEQGRGRRLAEAPDCVEYRVVIGDADRDAPRQYLFRFLVNDKLSESVLHLVNVRFSSRPWGPT